MPIPVIDLFAGPGGLGEGFSSLLNDRDERSFKIKLSIEKDKIAHKTLELRAFFREFPLGDAPKDYYEYLAGNIDRENLFKNHLKEAETAQKEAWCAELGGEETANQLVDERIEAALGARQNWVLIGGPPCQAYSLVGRSRVIGGEGIEAYEADPRHGLYKHYLRILAVHQPPVFVMENVKGLLSAKKAKQNIFEKILSDLRKPAKATPSARVTGACENLEYSLFPLAVTSGELLGQFSPEDFVLHSEDYGVPQARHRVIILGIRSDLKKKPEILEKTDKITVAKTIGDLPRLRSGLSKQPDSADYWLDAVQEFIDAPWFTSENLPNGLWQAMVEAAEKTGGDLGRGGRYLEGKTEPFGNKTWFVDKKLKGICNHETRGHIKEDLHRYFFAAVFAQKNGRSPLLEDLPKALLPKHLNVEAALKETKFNDRFRVQLADRPSTTVVSHISKDGHYYIHYDPTQCRSLTVREAARLQTFPDNYFFEGPRTEQYRQVGNAVPPLLAHKIAKIVAELFD